MANKEPAFIFDGSPTVPFHKFGPYLLRYLRAFPGTILVAIDGSTPLFRSPLMGNLQQVTSTLWRLVITPI